MAFLALRNVSFTLVDRNLIGNQLALSANAQDSPVGDDAILAVVDV